MFFRLSLFQKILQINCNESKQQQKLDADPKAIQQFNFTGNLDRVEGSKMFLIIKVKKGSFRFFKRNS